MRPKKPFMIERGNELAHIRYYQSIVTRDNLRVKWVDWEGTQFATKAEAQIFLDDPSTAALFEGAVVIEILDQVRSTSRAR